MKRFSFFVVLSGLLLIGVLCVMSTVHSTPARADAPPSPTQPQPVEKDMHEFMEYVFQPTYKRLQQSMRGEPTDNNAWKGIKADSLILAEGGNLLMIRTPTEEAAVWNELSAAVRDAGSNLYQAAKKKDYKVASQHYKSMLLKCNACHDKFAKGEHQLAP
jgi:hypothetical protein